MQQQETAAFFHFSSVRLIFSHNPRFWQVTAAAAATERQRAVVAIVEFRNTFAILFLPVACLLLISLQFLAIIAISCSANYRRPPCPATAGIVIVAVFDVVVAAFVVLVVLLVLVVGVMLLYCHSGWCCTFEQEVQ